MSEPDLDKQPEQEPILQDPPKPVDPQDIQGRVGD